jgi:hypothetical protein
MVQQFDGSNIFFMEDGWFNATSAAKVFGKRPEDWLRLNSTKEYIAVILEEFSITGFPVIGVNQGIKMSEFMLGYLLGILTGPLVVLVWVVVALWKDNSLFMGSK